MSESISVDKFILEKKKKKKKKKHACAPNCLKKKSTIHTTQYQGGSKYYQYLNRISFANAHDAWVDATVGADGAHNIIHPAAEVVVQESQAQLSQTLACVCVCVCVCRQPHYI